ANVIVLNKLDLVSEAQALEVKAIIEALNPGAKVLMAIRGEVPLESVLNTGLFDYEEASASAGWVRELQLEGEHKPETEEYGISSFAYKTAHPFDAEKLWEFLSDEKTWRGVLRSKGFFWVAADPRVAYEWAQAGGVSNVNPMGLWWASLPRDRWGLPEGEGPDQEASWHPRFGDRSQQLVFIGQRMDEAALRARLDACLLDAERAAENSRSWSGMVNPFPKFGSKADATVPP
ncbi:MAG: GTP-binding protein, partial [Acidobacteriota bacterium]